MIQCATTFYIHVYLISLSVNRVGDYDDHQICTLGDCIQYSSLLDCSYSIPEVLSYQKHCFTEALPWLHLKLYNRSFIIHLYHGYIYYISMLIHMGENERFEKKTEILVICWKSYYLDINIKECSWGEKWY